MTVAGNASQCRHRLQLSAWFEVNMSIHKDDPSMALANRPMHLDGGFLPGWTRVRESPTRVTMSGWGDSPAR